MKIFSALVFCVLLSACTTAADVQRDCAAVTQNFPAEVACINDLVQQDANLRGDSFVQEYVLDGQVLAEKVRTGALSENEARLQFARSYNRLRLQQSQMNAYDALAWERLSPRDTNCRVHGEEIRCRSY